VASFKNRESNVTRANEKRQRKALAALTGLGFLPPARAQYAPPYDAIIVDRDEIKEVAFAEFKDRTNYQPIRRGMDVFLSPGKYARLVKLGQERDLPVYFVVEDAPGEFFFVQLYEGLDAQWERELNPDVTQAEEHPDHDVILVPHKEFIPCGWMRQDIRDSSGF